MKTNQKGFSAVEIVLVVVIVALAGFIGWSAWGAKQSNPTENNSSQAVGTLEAYERSTTVPDDWNEYSNEEYGISLSYPSEYEIDFFAVPTSDGEQNVDSENAAEGVVIGVKWPEFVQVVYEAEIGIKKQSLEDTVGQLKKNFFNANGPELLSERNITMDGHTAREFRYKHEEGNVHTDYLYLVYANGYTYSLPTIHEGEEPSEQPYDLNSEDTLTLVESVRIN